MRRVMLSFALRVGAATGLGLVVLAGLLGLVAWLDGTVPPLVALLGQVLALSPLVAVVVASLSIAGLRQRGELVVLALSGRHPGGWSLAAALGAGLVVALGLMGRELLPAASEASPQVLVAESAVGWRSASGRDEVVLASAPSWTRDGRSLHGSTAPLSGSWRTLRLAAGPEASLAELRAGARTPDRRAWLLLMALTPLLAGSSAACGALAETSGRRGAGLAALGLSSAVWLLSVAATVLAARGLMSVGLALLPVLLWVGPCLWLWRGDARYSATT